MVAFGGTIASFGALATRNFTTFFAAILIVSPVAGFRPSGDDAAEDHGRSLAPHSTRVRAADSVLDHSAKAIEIEDIEARVSELERTNQKAGDR